ncbi:MAG TPA: biopolymer transporter ExbD [Gammaproteobacteria bacterium]|nr:biopolymer transporter ExbD [Gammaproteobacteria bacterium]
MNLQPQLDDEEPDVNLTPLIDVVLLLLVFFMVSTSFVKEAPLRVQLPEASLPTQSAQVAELEVIVNAEGNYFVNERALVNSRPETLRSALIKVAGEARDTPLTIRADAQTTHQSVVTVMDIAGKLGFTNVRIVTVPAGGNE